MFGTNPFKAIPKNLLGDPIVKKSEPEKPAAKKPAVGKKPKDDTKTKELPAKKVTCPYCKAVNLFPEGKASRFCGDCGKAYFR